MEEFFGCLAGGGWATVVLAVQFVPVVVLLVVVYFLGKVHSVEAYLAAQDELHVAKIDALRKTIADHIQAEEGGSIHEQIG